MGGPVAREVRRPYVIDTILEKDHSKGDIGISKDMAHLAPKCERLVEAVFAHALTQRSDEAPVADFENRLRGSCDGCHSRSEMYACGGTDVAGALASCENNFLESQDQLPNSEVSEGLTFGSKKRRLPPDVQADEDRIPFLLRILELIVKLLVSDLHQCSASQCSQLAQLALRLLTQLAADGRASTPKFNAEEHCDAEPSDMRPDSTTVNALTGERSNGDLPEWQTALAAQRQSKRMHWAACQEESPSDSDGAQDSLRNSDHFWNSGASSPAERSEIFCRAAVERSMKEAAHAVAEIARINGEWNPTDPVVLTQKVGEYLTYLKEWFQEDRSPHKERGRRGVYFDKTNNAWAANLRANGRAFKKTFAQKRHLSAKLVAIFTRVLMEHLWG